MASSEKLVNIRMRVDGIVEQDHLGFESYGPGHRLRHRRGFSHDMKIRFEFQERPEPLPDHFVIVDDE
jgi:hypothetical protein